MKRNEIRIRDPYILPHNDMYYMYATTGETELSYYYGNDMENWEYGGVAFKIPESFWAYKDVWAAEVHPYKEKFYLFVSLLGKNNLRGTQIAVADTPKGPFVPVSNRAVTPQAQSCIDGTLFVCDEKPYIIYSHDWPDNYIESEHAYVGEICAAELKEDLTEIVGEPKVLFASNEVPISKQTPHQISETDVRYGSDAPFVQKLSDGHLFLTWSPYLNGTYVVLSAISENGSIFGEWKHSSKAFFDKDGGHAMFFKGYDGNNYMCIHAPEKPQLERAHIFKVEECDDGLKITDEL